MRLAFGEFVIDVGERRVFSGAQEIRLTPKAFDLLRLLIENRPKAPSKQEIFDRLWPGTFVTENNLAALVADLRSWLCGRTRQACDLPVVDHAQRRRLSTR